MQDHTFEEPDEERARETVDALAEHETFFHARGDDRADEQLRSYLELFALGASLPSVNSLPLEEGRQDTNTRGIFSGTPARHMPLLSQPPVSGDSAPGDAGGHVEEERAA